VHISEMLTALQDPGIQVRLMFAPGPEGSELIDDTYNASTPSVLSALGLLGEIPARRRIAVLGDMRELGKRSEEEHRIVGRRAADVVDLLVTYGESARIVAEEALAVRSDEHRFQVRTFGEEEKGQLVRLLRGELRRGDIVLVKGSRGLRMETIVQQLRSDVAAGGETATEPADRQA